MQFSDKKSDTLAVVLNWNDLEMTFRCISSLLNQKDCSPDILVIDNQSKADPTGLLRSRFPEVEVLRNEDNLGVTGGRNVGIRFALQYGYEFVLFFDNDAFADRHMVFFLRKAAAAMPATAIFGPKIYRDDRKNEIWRAGCLSWKWSYLHSGHHILVRLCRLLRKKIPFWLDTLRGEEQDDEGQYNQVREIAFQIGCVQFVRASIFKTVGILDSDFMLYGSEDIDFCARVTKAGWKIHYIPEAKAWHRIGSSFSDSYYRAFYNTRNIILLARKNLDPLYFSYIFLLDFLLFTIPLMLGAGLVARQKNRLRGVLSGIQWNLKDMLLRGILLRRKKVVKLL